MSPSTSNRIESLFSRALEAPTEELREEFLARSCAGDARIRSRVEALLLAHNRAGSFLETPLIELDDTGFSLGFGDSPPRRTLRSASDTRIADTADTHVDLASILDPPTRPGDLGTFDGHRITDVLGRGGAGIVLKAFDDRLNRSVALKVLAPEWAAQPRPRQRFLREARAAAAVRHRHVVAIYAIAENANLPYLVMEYIPGGSLQDVLDPAAPLEVDRILRISEQVVSGLAAAHEQRLVHRDIKPANILLEEQSGDVKLTDFGLARTVDEVGITQDGVIAGTPQYMSPEQARGEPVDFRSDLFSIGSVMYSLCAGVPPFRAESTIGTLRKICDESPTPIATIREDVPAGLAELIEEMLEKSAEARPQTASDVAERLARLRLDAVAGETVPRRMSSPSAGRSWRQRKLIWIAAAFVAVVVAAVAIPPLLREPENVGTAKNDAPSSIPPKDNGETRPATNADRAKRNALLFDESVEPFEEIRRMAVPAAEATQRRLYDLAISPDGMRVYARCVNRQVYCWDTRTGELLRQFGGIDENLSAIAVSPDGTRLATGRNDRKLRLRDTETAKVVLTIPVTRPIRDAVFSPDGRELLVSLAGFRPPRPRMDASRRTDSGPRGPRKKNKRPPKVIPGRLDIYNTATGKRVRTLTPSVPAGFGYVDWSRDGRHIAVGAADGRVVLYDARRGEGLRHLRASGHPGPAYAVHFSHDGNSLYATGTTNLFWCWTVPRGAERFSRMFPSSVVRFAVSEDERWIAIGGALEIRLWDRKDPTGAIRELKGHTSPSYEVAFVPGADVLVSTGWDGTVRLWRLPGATGSAKAVSKPVVHRLRGIDGTASDTDTDGAFDAVETEKATLSIARARNGSAEDVALMEFDTTQFRGRKLAKAVLEFRITLLNASSVEPEFDLEFHAFTGDGKITREDGSVVGVRAGGVEGLDKKNLRMMRVPLDVKALQPNLATGGRIGLRISNTRGTRMLLGSRETYFKDSAPVLELHLQPTTRAP